MTTPIALIEACRARGVELTPLLPDRLQLRPARALTSELLDQIAANKFAIIALLTAEVSGPLMAPALDAIVSYRRLLERLWMLHGLGPGADQAECRQLLRQQQRLHDALGPAFAEAVVRQWCRDHAARLSACGWCGELDGRHEPDVDGHPCPLTPAPGPRDASGWLAEVPGYGARRPSAFAPCAGCGAGTFVVYGLTPLCRVCADAGPLA